MNRKLIILIGLVLCSLLVKAQEKVGLSILQDPKMLILGDEQREIKKGMLDILTRVTLQGNQQKYGYMQIYPEFEYTNINGNYWRFTFNGGYVFNQLFLDNLEAGIMFNVGIIDRYKLNYWTYGGSLEVNYKLSNNFKIVTSSQLIRRGDLAYRYNTKELKPAFYVGVEFKIFE